MRVVLDANVLVAAFATQGICHVLLEICLSDHMLFSSSHILKEVERALRKKLKAPEKTTRETIAYLSHYAHLHEPVTLPSTVCRDPDDAPVLGLAVATQCDCLVTGDQDLLILATFQGIPILSPRDFYTRLQKKSR